MCAAAGGPKHSPTLGYRPTSSSTNCGTPPQAWRSRSGANIKALQNMLGHASAGLTLDRYGHLYDSDVDTVGHAINEVITVTCGHGVGTVPAAGRHLRAVSADDLQ